MYTMTPLHIAVDKNDFETVNFFMARLENKMPKSESGMTPLHICAKVGIKLQNSNFKITNVTLFHKVGYFASPVILENRRLTFEDD